MLARIYYGRNRGIKSLESNQVSGNPEGNDFRYLSPPLVVTQENYQKRHSILGVFCVGKVFGGDRCLSMAVMEIFFK